MYENILAIVNEWNPIGIYPLLKEEYHSEVMEILEEALKTDSTEKLATQISRIFKENFDEHFGKSYFECTVIAEKVLACCKK